MRRSAALAGGLLLILGAALLPVVPADAADGTVPPEVSAFVADRLLDRLDDMYGPRHDGTGTDFAGADTGTATQVWAFTEDARSGRGLDDPIVPRGEWLVPILVAGSPIGAAVVAADPVTLDGLHLDAWDPDPVLGAATYGMAPRGALVHDPQTSSWFALVGRSVRPIIPGTSGVEKDRPLSRLDLDDAPPRIDPVNPATIRALAVLAGLVVVALLALAVPRIVRRRRAGEETIGDRAVPRS